MFAAKIYAGDVFMGHASASSLSALKRSASKLCNNLNKPLDTMTVYMADGKEVSIRYTRLNKVSPNNTITRGSWR